MFNLANKDIILAMLEAGRRGKEMVRSWRRSKSILAATDDLRYHRLQLTDPCS